MNQPILRSRQAPAGDNLPAVSSASEALDVELRRAHAIAKATEALPRSYRNQPGAVLLADQWARARGIDTLTAIQTVAFIDGKPVVDAAMQRALAERAGFEVRVEGEVTDKAATVAVYKGGELLGRETFTIDMAKQQGLTGKKNWQQTPRNMLVARATTNALRWYAPSVVVGVFTDDDLTADPVDVLSQQPAEPAAEHAPEADESVIDAEVVEPQPEQPASEPQQPQDEPPDTGGTVTKDDLKAALHDARMRQVEAIRHAQQLGGDVFPRNLDEIAEHPELAAQVLDWIRNGGERQ